MWPNKAHRLCIIIEDEAVSVLALSKNAQSVTYAEYKIEHYELYQSLIFNPKKFQNFLHDFLKKQALKTANAVVLLRGSVLHEVVCCDPQAAAPFDGFFDWMQLSDAYWYGVGLSYPTWLQLSLLFTGTDITVKSMVPYFVVMYDLVKGNAAPMLDQRDDFAMLQHKVQHMLNDTYAGHLDRKFLLSGLNALFDS